jgi:hypothetical protein
VGGWNREAGPCVAVVAKEGVRGRCRGTCDISADGFELEGIAVTPSAVKAPPCNDPGVPGRKVPPSPVERRVPAIVDGGSETCALAPDKRL